MLDFIHDYIKEVSQKYRDVNTSEYGYRKPFEILLENIFSSLSNITIEHDAKAKDGNKPDFVVLKNGIPVLYIETKDIGVSLDKVEKSDQMRRYYGYANLILTDYLEFRFYRNGQKYCDPIVIGTYDKKKRTITGLTEKYNLLK